MEGAYGVINNSLSLDAISKMEVMENHQTIKALQNKVAWRAVRNKHQTKKIDNSFTEKERNGNRWHSPALEHKIHSRDLQEVEGK